MEKKTFERLQTFSPNSFVRKRIWQTDTLHCNIYCFEPGQQNSGYINTSLDHHMIVSVVQCPLPVEHVPVEPGDVSSRIRL
jgi:hypothetical protein